MTNTVTSKLAAIVCTVLVSSTLLFGTVAPATPIGAKAPAASARLA